MSEFRDLKPEEFRIFFEPASKGDSGALRIRDFLELPFADDVTLKSPFGNIDIPVPDGSIRQHLMRRLDEFGGMDAYVTLNIASVSFHVEVPIEGNKPRTPEEMDAMMRRELETRGLRSIHVPISGSNLPTGRSSPDHS
jgi:hypothetical protein